MAKLRLAKTTTDEAAKPALAPRILMVEDDAAYAGLVGFMLDAVKSVRFLHDHVTSIGAAIQQLTKGSYDIVLLDLGLPDAQGLEALTTLIEIAPDLPVMILSGAENEVLALQAVQAGAQDYLIKGQATTDLLGRAIRYAIERKRLELQIKRLAYRDSLTQLPNRSLLMEHLDAALKRARRMHHVAGLFFIDIDRFKQINDSLGHEAGDEVLRQLAERLRHSLRDPDTLARWGGDEFVAVVEVSRRSDLALIAEALVQKLKAPFVISDKELFITASIGVSSFPADGADAYELIHHADRAMYRAKAEGRDTHRYASRLPAKASPKLAAGSGLRRAIEHGHGRRD
jgi:diguanylate cyclase (GGDEF)-like protein